jgi:hypothetical protein
MRRATTLALAAAVLTLLVPAPAGAVDAFGLKVFGEEGQELATFRKAKCRRGTTAKTKGTFFAGATSTNGQWKLFVEFFDTFRGFRPYELVMSPRADPVLRVYPVGAPNQDFSNEHVPPFDVPGEGEIRFPRKGKEMRAGFIPVMWNQGGTDGVVVVGGVDCRYPK